ncbi:MAG: hypothetical protein VB859_02110 [Planctomycetaceae bacterium]
MFRPLLIHRSPTLLLALLLALATAGLVRAEEIPRHQHPWGRFAPGSWSRTRVVTETIGEDGQKIRYEELVTTRLLKVDRLGVTLQTETARGDRVMKSSPMTLAWDGTGRDGQRKERLSLGEVKFKGRSHSCQTHTVTRVIGKSNVSTKSWYCPDTPPHFLKQLIRVRGPKPRHTAIDVVKLNATRTVKGQEYTGWETRTVIADRSGRSRMMSFHSKAVPGGLVQSQGESHDRQSARVGTRSKTLDAFHAVPAPPADPSDQ